MNAVEVDSPAKINLALRVGPRRPDGYHEIESLIVPLEFCDTLRVTARDDEQIVCRCSDPAVPTDARNLAVRAAQALRGRLARPRGATIEIEKRIPAGAGLGGGSGNAAATLRALNELWRLNLPPESLAALGAQIGSDVPAMVHRRACVVSGRGEIVSLEAPPVVAEVLLLLPPIDCATAEVYARFDALPPPAGGLGLCELLQTLVRINAGEDAFDRLGELLFNDLTDAAYASAPRLGEVARSVSLAVGTPLAMSGSGAAHFLLYPPDAAGRDRLQQDLGRIAAALSGVRVLETRTLHA